METPTPDDIATDVQERSNTALKRGLASRHMQMIAIGGAIGTGLFLAPTGSRDSIANLSVFRQGAFNVEAAEFVTSIGGTFTCAGYDFAGIYGAYKYRGNVILEQWEAERDPVPTDKG